MFSIKERFLPKAQFTQLFKENRHVFRVRLLRQNHVTVTLLNRIVFFVCVVVEVIKYSQTSLAGFSCMLHLLR